MTISLLHHEPTEVILPCSLSNGIFECNATTRNVSMGGVWVVVENDDCNCVLKDNLGECHIQIDGYRLDIPSYFTRIYNREVYIEFLTLTIEQKLVLGFILSKQYSQMAKSSR